MPTFDADLLPSLTRERIPDLAGEDDLRVEPLAQEGSGRAYYRLNLSDGSPSGLVVMHFGTERAENLRFAPITAFLHACGVACPRIRAEDEERHLLWLEDLGGRDLTSLENEDWESVRALRYKSALREAARLHALTPERFAASSAGLELERPFDAKLYAWEQDYFFENFAPHFSAASPADIARARNHATLEDLREGLASLPRALVHRDFQSRNVLLEGERTVLIDYQGMRMGRPEYDLAALLFDPYVAFEDSRRDELFEFHRDHLAADEGAPALSTEIFLQCAAQRLMQALGAYGFLGVVKEKPHFLDSVGPGVQNLRSVIDRLPSLDFLRPILELKS